MSKRREEILNPEIFAVHDKRSRGKERRMRQMEIEKRKRKGRREKTRKRGMHTGTEEEGGERRREVEPCKGKGLGDRGIMMSTTTVNFGAGHPTNQNTSEQDTSLIRTPERGHLTNQDT